MTLCVAGRFLCLPQYGLKDPVELAGRQCFGTELIFYESGSETPSVGAGASVAKPFFSWSAPRARSASFCRI